VEKVSFEPEKNAHSTYLFCRLAVESNTHYTFSSRRVE